MKKVLEKLGFNKENIVSFGNMFLLANGRYGYRGTLEEYSSNEMVSLNVLGLYDQYQDKWRESINLPNPFSIHTYIDNKEQNVLINPPLNHKISLNIFDAAFSRETEFEDSIIKSTRFVSSDERNLLVNRYVVTSKKEATININLKVDLDIYEINGPHFVSKEIEIKDNVIHFQGVSNENKKINTYTLYKSNVPLISDNNGLKIEKTVKKDEEIIIEIYSYIGENFSSLLHLANLGFKVLLENHKKKFNKEWKISRVEIDDESAQFEIDYSIYHLLILMDPDSVNSIPARGLSGQTYKGAIFWDTETFILPFFTLTNPKFARNLLVYRINTLKGAIKKAQSFGYKGAFYAWESQEDGVERCSKYNVTDPVTNEPIRTYFDEKQIHISGDIVLAFERYIEYTGDTSILEEGGYDVINECAKFYMDRATFRDDKYHFDDVIGPDEYHERINDNAFTNYVAYKTIEIANKYSPNNEYEEFLNKIYLPKPNEDKIIEQFSGYFSLEDVGPKEVISRRKNEREYLGYIASKTKVIKQADVISLIAILNENWSNDIAKENYKYYLPYTEHGSSLSSSMYSIVGSHIGEKETSYKLFRKSSGIDLGTDQKMYAGGIYIGGTHPASNAGAYLSIIYGFVGLSIKNNKPTLNPHLPDEINKIEFKFYYQNKLYRAYIDKHQHIISEVTNND